jgi:serine/threonine-protein kinase SRPK3
VRPSSPGIESSASLDMDPMQLCGFAETFGNSYSSLALYSRCSSDLRLRKRKYVTIKVCKRECVQAMREIQVLNHLNSIKSCHEGSLLVRKILDSFEIIGSGGRHQCLVHEPLGTSLSRFRSIFPSGRLPEDILKALLIHVLQSLDFLHSEAGVIHAGAF